MSVHRKMTALLLSLLLGAGMLLGLFLLPAEAQAAYVWNDSHGPGNGDAPALAVDTAGNVIYRGTSSRGVWKYQAGEWVSLGGELNSLGVNVLAYDQTRHLLYAGTGVSGVWRCANPSTSPAWSKISGSLDIGDSSISSLACDQVRNVLYAGASYLLSGKGVWCSTNPNAPAPSWSATGGGGLNDYFVSALTCDTASNLVYAGTLLFGAWRYDPEASSWDKISADTDVGKYNINSISFDATDNLLYAGASEPGVITVGKGVWQCADPDPSSYVWTQVSDGSNVGDFIINALSFDQSRDLLYAGTGSSGVWRYDSGASPQWAKRSDSGNVGDFEIRALAYDGGHDVLCVGTGKQGVWSCTGPNTTRYWVDTGGNACTSSIQSMVFDSAHGVLFAGADGLGVWRCENTGSSPSWVKISENWNIGNLSVKSLAYDERRNLLYAGTTGFGVWRCTSPNGSHSWVKISDSPNVGDYIIDSMSLDAARNVLYAGASRPEFLVPPSGQGVWRCSTPDASQTWKKMSAPTDLGDSIVSALACDSNHDVLYAGRVRAGSNG